MMSPLNVPDIAVNEELTFQMEEELQRGSRELGKVVRVGEGGFLWRVHGCQ